MDTLIEKMKEDVEEYGELHNETCPCNMEDPDACDCDNMKQIKHLAEEHMQKVNEYWLKMCEAHRPYCTPEGNKDITRMLGKKNRISKSPLSK